MGLSVGTLILLPYIRPAADVDTCTFDAALSDASAAADADICRCRRCCLACAYVAHDRAFNVTSVS